MWWRDRNAQWGRSSVAFGALVASQLVACNSPSPGEASSTSSAVQVAPSQSAVASAPPTGPAALGDPRAFHFVVPMAQKPYVVVLLDPGNVAASAGWVKPGARIDAISIGPARGNTAGIPADEAKLPTPLRLRGVTVHLYADDMLLCDGTLTVPRVGVVGDRGAIVAYSDSTRDPSTLLAADVDRVLLYEIDVPAACASRFSKERARIAWARDASLPAPNVVGRSAPVGSADAPEQAREALKLSRARPSFASAQKSVDDARKVAHLEPAPLETALGATWTRYVFGGEKRGYLAIVEECGPPMVDIGIDFRENADGSLEFLTDRAATDTGKRTIVDPLVLVDVDRDGRLEAIHAGNTYILQSFDGSDIYASLGVDHCT